MKRAFVIRLSPDTNPAKGKFQGHVEEVDIDRELKFRSVEEFLAFVREGCVYAKGTRGRAALSETGWPEYTIG